MRPDSISLEEFLGLTTNPEVFNIFHDELRESLKNFPSVKFSHGEYSYEEKHAISHSLQYILVDGVIWQILLSIYKNYSSGFSCAPKTKIKDLCSFSRSPPRNFYRTTPRLGKARPFFRRMIEEAIKFSLLKNETVRAMELSNE